MDVDELVLTAARDELPRRPIGGLDIWSPPRTSTTCETCGKTLSLAPNISKRFCGPTCRQAQYRVRRRKGVPIRHERATTIGGPICPQGHDMTDPDNVGRNPSGHRYCKSCDRDYHRGKKH